MRWTLGRVISAILGEDGVIHIVTARLHMVSTNLPSKDCLRFQSMVCNIIDQMKYSNWNELVSTINLIVSLYLYLNSSYPIYRFYQIYDFNLAYHRFIYLLLS